MERPELPRPLGTERLAVDFPNQLGRYAAIASLGDGGMAQVFLAIQRGPYASNKLVVIKRVKAESRHDPTFQKMFVDEARIAMLLSHPNIVNTYDLVADGDALYLTMEFIEGHSLLDTMKRVGRSGVPRELYVWILSKVLAALAYAHSLRDFKGSDLGIVHRDVSPSNVTLTYRGEVKLLDFGIAKAVGRLSTTHEGTLKGKVRYMSPEQCSLQPTSARSDLYSVGVMLWEGLARQRMHPNGTPVQIAEAHARGLRKPIEEVWPNVPPALVEVLRRALAINPAERYATAREFQRDLEDYLSSLPPATQPGSTFLAKLVSDAFALERARLRETIVARVAESGDGPVSEDVPPPPAQAPAPEAQGRRTPSRPSEPASPGPSPAPVAAPERKRGWLVVGGVVLLAAIGAGIGIRHVGQSAGPAAIPSAPPSRATTETPRAAIPPPRAVAAPSVPAGPVVQGRSTAPSPAAPPLIEPVAPHNANLRALPESRLDRPRRKPTGAGVSRGALRNGAVGELPETASTAPSATKAQPGQPLPAPARLTASPDHEPGMDLGRPDSRRGGARAIDEKDPYAP